MHPKTTKIREGCGALQVLSVFALLFQQGSHVADKGGVALDLGSAGVGEPPLGVWHEEEDQRAGRHAQERRHLRKQNAFNVSARNSKGILGEAKMTFMSYDFTGVLPDALFSMPT